MITFADAEQSLAESLPDYESRPQQQRFAEAVEGLLADSFHFQPGHGPARQHLMAQAGTGVGKSLGYLIPAILSGRRIIVSVTTKALQDQLAQKDLPFLTEHLGKPFTWAMLKGRSNYFCARRAGLADESEVANLGEILRQANQPGFGGTQEDFSIEIDWKSWALICSDPDDCDDGCTAENGCFVKAARYDAQNSQIVVVNHALFFTDLVMKGTEPGPRDGGMLSGYDAVIFDEAHEIESYAASVLGGQVSQGTFTNLTGEIRTWVGRYADDPEHVEQQSAAVLGAAERLFGELRAGRLREAEISRHGDALVAMLDSISDLVDGFGHLTYKNLPLGQAKDKAASRKRSIKGKLDTARTKINEVIMSPLHEMVRWVEERESRGQSLKTIKISPVEIGPFMRDYLLDHTPVVFVSATLAQQGNFKFMADRYGVENFTSLDVGSPFDFAKQSMLYIPATLPAPAGATQNVWASEANEEIVDLLRISKGRALVLFTSNKHMKDALWAVKRKVDYPIRMQGEASNGELVNWLKNSEDGVIFGTKSFFTGVDIQGSALSMVIIAKLPFPVPTEPLYQAKSEAIERRRGNAFGELMMPETSLILQQAVGRLIRHRGDFGVVAVLDPRLVTKGYGKQMIRDLPPMPVSKKITEVGEWFAEASARNGATVDA